MKLKELLPLLGGKDVLVDLTISSVSQHSLTGRAEAFESYGEYNVRGFQDLGDPSIPVKVFV